ncbi:MAG: hypothetical protein RLZZ484_155 [Pseudomonadota bacterium]
MMNGAESLARTLLAQEVEVCFSNPGTSEMHFVAALDKVDGMRCILGLFEGVATGAADAYYRMADKPACTLLHLGPGLANGLANLHNAKKAGSGIVNVVGEHARHHIAHNAPLTSDIRGVATPMSAWVKTSESAKTVAHDGALAVHAARQAPGQIATLILPADTAWEEGSGIDTTPYSGQRTAVAGEVIEQVAQALQRPGKTALLLGGIGVREPALNWVGKIAARTGCDVLSEYNTPRLQRGAGRVITRRIPYAVDAAVAMLKDFDQIILVGAKQPVAFFAYPDKPSVLTAAKTQVMALADASQDIVQALSDLSDRLQATALPAIGVADYQHTELPSGALDPVGIGRLLAALIPEGAVVVDESVSTGRGFDLPTTHARPHDWLNVMGGAIGFGMPGAVGAAVGAPGRPVILLEGDGSGMYTLQALWTMARENLNVKVLVFANRAYQILRGELKNVGAGTPGKNATDMLTLDRPNLDWVALAKGHGVPGRQATDLTSLAQAFQAALAEEGPFLIEVLM